MSREWGAGSTEQEAGSTAEADSLLPAPCSMHRAWLAERGETIVGSGGFRAGGIEGAIHTDFGPPGQDKSVNQDYALAWLPAKKAADGLQPRLVVALSDGLTNSYRSECAAALACWTSIRAWSRRPARDAQRSRVVRLQRSGPGARRVRRRAVPRSGRLVSQRTVRVNVEVHFEKRRAIPDHAHAGLVRRPLSPGGDRRRRRCGAISPLPLGEGQGVRAVTRTVRETQATACWPPAISKVSKSMPWARPIGTSASWTVGAKNRWRDRSSARCLPMASDEESARNRRHS